MSNINQWKFEELPDSKIIITEEVYDRLMILMGRSAYIASEHHSFLMGYKEKDSDTWIINSVNENEDYVNTGNDSLNPGDYSVSAGINEASEMIDKLRSSPAVIDVHTHPSGITENYRFFSQTDLSSSKTENRIISSMGGTSFSGLIGVDRINGNISFSIIWYNKLNNKFYRVKDILLRKMDEYGTMVDIPFPKYGDTQLIFTNWGNDDLKMQPNVEEEITNLRHK